MAPRRTNSQPQSGGRIPEVPKRLRGPAAFRTPGGYAIAVERRRTPTRPSASPLMGSPAVPVSPSAMRAIIAAGDGLRSHLLAHSDLDLGPADMRRPGTELADLTRYYQTAMRQFLHEWLKNPKQTAWMVDSASGRVLDLLDADSTHAALPEDVQWGLAEDQPLHGLRQRHERPGIGVPVIAWVRRVERPGSADLERYTAALTRTAIISVAPEFDRRVRAVRLELFSPLERTDIDMAGVLLPLAADFSAAVAQTITRERQPAATAYGVRDVARRSGGDGFVALTPFAPHLTPLIVMEGVGLSPVRVAQVANAIAGDVELRRRYQVWLYCYPMVVPLFVAARQLRADLERFHARFAAAAGRPVEDAAVLGYGPGAILARTLLIATGSRLWDRVFVTPLHKVDLNSTDRQLLESLFFWEASPHVGRVIVTSAPENADALTSGVGLRAARLLQRQPGAFRSAIERIFGVVRAHVRSVPAGAAAGEGVEEWFDEPVVQAIANAALEADRALVALDAGASPAGVAALYTRRGSLAPLESQPVSAQGDPFAPRALAALLNWLRPPH